MGGLIPETWAASPSSSLGLCEVFWHSPRVKAQIAKGAPAPEAPGRWVQGVWLQAGKMVANKQGTTVLLWCCHGHRSQPAATGLSVPPLGSHSVLPHLSMPSCQGRMALLGGLSS